MEDRAITAELLRRRGCALRRIAERGRATAVDRAGRDPDRQRRAEEMTVVEFDRQLVRREPKSLRGRPRGLERRPRKHDPEVEEAVPEERVSRAQMPAKDAVDVLENRAFPEGVLANSFYVGDVDYRWERGELLTR
jgi:hypothetical protein